MNPSSAPSLTSQTHQPRSAFTLEQAHLQRLVHHPNLAWFDLLLIATTAPGPALLTLSDADNAENLGAKLTGHHSTLFQMETEELTTLLQTTPQDLLKATRMTLILCDWLCDQPVKAICGRWDIHITELQTMLARTRRLMDTMVTIDLAMPPTIDTYRLRTLAKMLHGFAPGHTSLLALPSTTPWLIRKLVTARISSLEKLAATPLKRLEALFNPALADQLHHDAQHLLEQHPPTYFTAHAFHQDLPTIQETTPLRSIFSVDA